jgi:hypothetical protein
MNQESNDLTKIRTSINSDDSPLTDDLVVDYLQDNPDFFNRNNHLMTSLRLVDEQRGTVSLVERQQQQLRQKAHDLEDEITQLMSVAAHNEQLFVLYSDLYLRLLDCQSAAELLDCLNQTTIELLSLSSFKLWLTPFSDNVLVHDSLTTNDCAGVMQNRLTDKEFYFGRLQESEQHLIFSKSSSGSVVLIHLSHEGKTLGFLAIGSENAHHFEPHMDTLLLSQFKRLVAKLLHQHLVI